VLETRQYLLRDNIYHYGYLAARRILTSRAAAMEE
jgi:hypothetical protein